MSETLRSPAAEVTPCSRRPVSKPSSPSTWLSAILALHIALGIWYSFVNPLFEAGDERWHYPYVKALADGHGLAVQPENPVVYNWRQQGSQPPLYYLLAAGLTAWIDTGPPRSVVPENPHAIVGQPHALGNKNMALARPAPQGPEWGVVLAAHLIRVATVLIGAVTVWATYLYVRQILPAASPWLALVAAAWVAFLPEYLYVGASVNNDALVTSLTALALVAINAALQRPASRRRWILVGVLAGLAALTKLNGAGVAGLALVAIAGRAWHATDRRWVPTAVAATVLLPTLLAGWWFLRNLQLYGDPTGLTVLLDIVGRRNISWAELAGEAAGVRYSFWGVLGGFNVPLPEWQYGLYDALALLALLGLVGQIVRPHWSRVGPVNRPALLLGLLWLSFTGAALIRFTQSTMGSQGRYLFPALPILAVLVGWGLAGWLRPVARSRLTAGLVVVLVVGASLVPIAVIRPAYALPRRLAADQIGSIPNPVRVTFGDRIQLLGFQVGRPDGSFRTATAGQPIAVTLYWQVSQPVEENFSVFVHLLDRQNRVLGQANSYPGAGTYPTTRWQVGEIIQDVEYLVVDPDAPLPALARIEVGLYRFPSLERLPAQGDRAKENRSIFLSDLRVTRPEVPQALPNPAGIRFGDQLEVVDSSHEPAGTLAPGSPLRIDLRWRALSAPLIDYTVFLHLVDASGQVLAQSDSEPRAGTYPTSVWEPGELIPDTYTLALPGTLAPGRYSVQLGVYRRETGERLPSPGSLNGAPVLLEFEVGK